MSSKKKNKVSDINHNDKESNTIISDNEKSYNNDYKNLKAKTSENRYFKTQKKKPKFLIKETKKTDSREKNSSINDSIVSSFPGTSESPNKNSSSSKSASCKKETTSKRRSSRIPKIVSFEKKDYSNLAGMGGSKEREQDQKMKKDIAEKNRKLKFSNRLHFKKPVTKILKKRKCSYLINCNEEAIVLNKRIFTYKMKDPEAFSQLFFKISGHERKKKVSVLPHNEGVINSYIKYQEYFNTNYLSIAKQLSVEENQLQQEKIQEKEQEKISFSNFMKEFLMMIKKTLYLTKKDRFLK